MNNKNLIVVFAVAIFSIHCNAQQHKVYIDDSLIVYEKSEPLLAMECAYDLKDSLPDGTYILYSILKADSNLCSAKNIIMQGSYLNGLKHGAFVYYRCIPDKNNIVVEKIPYTFGKINGDVFYGDSLSHYKSITHYKDGKKNGQSIQMQRYVKNSKLSYFTEYTITYKNDSVIEWYEFYQPSSLFRRIGYGSLLEGECVVLEFDTLGNLVYKYIFKDENLIELYEYNNLALVCHYFYEDNIYKIGEPAKYYSIVSIRGEMSFGLMNKTPINGEIIYYNMLGEVEKIDKYKDREIIR